MRKSIPLITAIAFAAAAAAAQQGAPGEQSAAGTQQASGAHVTSPDFSQSMDKLQQAARRLRESIQSMARKPAGPDREQAIKDAHDALFETQQAMLALPTQRRGTGAVSTTSYDNAVKQAMKAADRLDESVQSVAQQPAGEAGDRAMNQANSALLATQQAISDTQPAGDSTRSMGDGDQRSTAAATQSSGNSAAPAAGAAIVLLPLQMASDENLANGCWVRFYDDKNFNGSTLTLAGPVEMPRMYPAGSVWRDWESAKVGRKARVTTYDNENFRQRTAKLDPGQRVADLHDNKLGWFDEVHSARVSCTS